MRLPSGDQTGLNSLMLGVLVTSTWPLPLAFITNISDGPLKLLWKAIFEPSGDQAGAVDDT